MKAPRVFSIAVATSGLLVASSPGHACSFALRKLTSAQIRQQARNDFSRSSAVIDAEVIQPMKFGADWKPGLTPIAYLRAIRVYKGRVHPDMVPVVYISSCDIGLAARGQRLRVLLSGEGVFRAEQGKNGGGIADLPTYDAEIVRLLGRRKPAGVAHFHGALSSPG